MGGNNTKDFYILKKVFLIAGLCALGYQYDTQAMIPAMGAGFIRGAALPAIVAAAYLVEDKGPAQEKLAVACLAVGTGGVLGAIGGGLAHLFSGKNAAKALSRAKQLGVFFGTLTACGFLAGWWASGIKVFK
jgi:hypothetical protein